jgi:hypothetical protein
MRRVIGAGKQREFRPDEISDIEVRPSGTQSGNKTYWKLTLNPVGGKPQTLVSELASRTDAQQLAREIEKSVGLHRADERSPISLETELPADLR